MAKKTNVPVCVRCETPLRSASSFCSACGGPTAWASHDERIEWEVRQWRKSRESTEAKPQMMLVRTEAGYEPMAVARYNDYVWDQPLHPEGQAETQSRLAPAPAVPVHAPVRPAVSEPPTPVVERPDPHPIPTNGNGNGVHESPARPAPAPAASAESVAPAIAPPDIQPDGQPGTGPDLEPAPAEAAGTLFGSNQDVPISKKAVAIAIALVVGLPFGGKIIGLASGDPTGAARDAAVAALPKPAAVVAARSGFEQLGPDAVRFAVVVQNPNKSFEASGVTVSVVVRDSRGRLVGSDTERITALPASGALGVVGAVGVSGPAAKMTVKVRTSSFEESAPAKTFNVRKVRLSRGGGVFVVRAEVSGVRAVPGARVVAVYLGRSGKVVGGDFTYIDIPRSPRFAKLMIPTTGVLRTVARVEVYVLPR